MISRLQELSGQQEGETAQEESKSSASADVRVAEAPAATAAATAQATATTEPKEGKIQSLIIFLPTMRVLLKVVKICPAPIFRGKIVAGVAPATAKTGYQKYYVQNPSY